MFESVSSVNSSQQLAVPVRQSSESRDTTTQDQQRARDSYARYARPENVQNTVDAANRELSLLNIELNVRIHEGTGNFIVSVVNSDTGDVIRDVPPESSLDFLARVHEMVGIVMNVSV